MLPKSDTRRAMEGRATSIRDLEPRARDADDARERAEREAMSLRDGRERRRVGRTEPISLKTFLHIKKMMLDMANAEQKSYTEIFEDAVKRRYEAMKGQKA